jgi:site-specific recombinase XerD
MLVKPIEAPAVCSRDALLQDFEGELLQQGYPPSTVHRKKRLFADLSDWLHAQELTAGDLSFRLADRFLRDRRSAGFARHKTQRTLRPILDYLHRLKLTPPLEAPVREGPASVILDRYRLFLTMERSLIDTTVERYIDRLRPFLDSRNSADGPALELGNLRPADIISFVVARCPRQNSSTAKLTVTALRSFLGFLHLEGITERSLVGAVPSVARRRLAGLPKGLEPDQVQRLLASCHANTPVGCRDLAILTLLVRLGLRRGEVAKLMLDDIEWRAGTIVVRGKGNCIERIPLPQDVGLRLVEYLEQARPANALGRAVFVRCVAPHHHLTPTRVSTIVADAARRANLGRVHAHRLRHTAATQLLRTGASLPEIGQLLRHVRTETTAIYAKVDRNGLRMIARPWPGDVQ